MAKKTKITNDPFKGFTFPSEKEISNETMSFIQKEVANRPGVKERQQRQAKERWENMSEEEKLEHSKRSSKTMALPHVKEAQRNAQLGRKKTKEEIEKHRQTHLGRKRPASTIKRMTRLYIGTNVDTGEEIIAKGTQGVKDLGFSQSMVSECCNGKREACKGYTWRKEIVEINND